jgi:aryl-alcohol dehydrogenase-like predicted oxidoreductase
MGTDLHPARGRPAARPARELGVNLIDSAECYGDHLAEELIGAAIGQRRDDWVIATKFGHQFHPQAMGQDR